MKGPKGLIPDLESLDLNSLEDMTLALARTMEISLLQAGATPGKDYTLLDCFKLAQPFALERFSNSDRMSFHAGTGRSSTDA